jgi:hypothetical protein
MAVRIFAVLSAYLQTFHARLSHEPEGAWVLWASLPIIAAVLYEIHLRYAKREALIRANATYTAPAPAFGTLSWMLYPAQTFDALKQTVERRKSAILAHAIKRNPIIAAVEEVKRPELSVVRQQIPRGKRSDGRKHRKDAPRINERIWLQRNGYQIGDFGRIPEYMHAAYLARENVS